MDCAPFLLREDGRLCLQCFDNLLSNLLFADSRQERTARDAGRLVLFSDFHSGDDEIDCAVVSVHLAERALNEPASYAVLLQNGFNFVEHHARSGKSRPTGNHDLFHLVSFRSGCRAYPVRMLLRCDVFVEGVAHLIARLQMEERREQLFISNQAHHAGQHLQVRMRTFHGEDEYDANR